MKSCLPLFPAIFLAITVPAAALPLTLSNVWSGPLEVAPAGGFAGTTTVLLSNDAVHLRYDGPDGALDYEWKKPSASSGVFGELTLQAQKKNGLATRVPLARDAAISWIGPVAAGSATWTPSDHGYTLERRYLAGGNPVMVRIAAQLVGKSLVLSIVCDQPVVAALNMGNWGPAPSRRQLVLPYYPGAACYLPNENLFVNALLDWTASSATRQDATTARYEPRTDGTRATMSERAIFSAAWYLPEILPNPPNPPSPWRAFLADKIVIDTWGGTFTNVARNLQKLADYGITNCVALIHVWQRSGYDNALPMHYPANATYGGDVGLSNLVAAAARMGILCAIHENYVDYYPNYDHYNSNDIALDSSGKLMKAWFNAGTGIQSYAVKPNAILRLAASQSPQIHRRYNTRADFLDVHSSVPPWFHVDMRAGEEGAGQFRRVWDMHRRLWAYERQLHGGPVFGEGCNHWYWSGCLDGVEAQFGIGWAYNGGFSAPLAVDLDLLKIHPLQFNHGMGYLTRWWPSDASQCNWFGPPPLAVLDRYRVQEIAYGHAGFLDNAVYQQIPDAWLEYHLLTPVSARYALARPLSILYQNNGVWRDSTETAKLEGSGLWDRVQIGYENGLTITANNGPGILSSGQWQLPALGWLAQGAGVTAGTVLFGQSMADFADTGDSLFVNARAARDWNRSGYRGARPAVSFFQQIGDRAFRVTYKWGTHGPLPKDYACFVHFCTNGSILAQQDHPLRVPTSHWTDDRSLTDGPWNVTLPSTLKDGDYDWLIGLYDSTGDGSRVPLQGQDDGSRRIRLGTLRVAGKGRIVRFIAEPRLPASDPANWYARDLNADNPAVDFGDARTDGSFWLHRDGNQWRLKTWPRDRQFTIELSDQRFPMPEKIICDGGVVPEVHPERSGLRWRLPLTGAEEYRWPQPNIKN